MLHCVLSSGAKAGDDRWNWSYCPPPYPPACVEVYAKSTNKTAEKASAIPPRDRLACEQAVEHYVASVFAYRVCLSGETERAVREANRVLQILKCPIDKRYCYDLPQTEPAPAKKRSGR
ncbi:hypothetical protein [uncultured Rhodoblastus sp.]|uniref:hypothetical protein n=1 Tax=uncultured Rhodoblastus sp. TaxID=543037 RepID=UPI0025FFB1E5|nr:hypothetical protein [uncultured Rhodoblastus sp.]